MTHTRLTMKELGSYTNGRLIRILISDRLESLNPYAPLARRLRGLRTWIDEQPGPATDASGDTAPVEAETAAGRTALPWEFRVYAEGCLLSSTQMKPGSLTRAALMGVRVISAVPIDDDQSNLTDLSPDAEFIVRACNSHDAMLEALQTAREVMEISEVYHAMVGQAGYDPYKKVIAAIAAATES